MSGGYDLELFIDQEEAKKNCCGVCKEVLKNPTFVGCKNEHSFCSTCVEGVYKHKPEPMHPFIPQKCKPKCPLCDQELDEDEKEPDNEKNLKVIRLTVKCKDCNKWQGQLANYVKHKKKECGKDAQSQPQQPQENGYGRVNGFQIQCKTLKGGTVYINCESTNDTIETLRQKISDKEAVPLGNVRLIFLGQTLQDWNKDHTAKNTLDDYKIKKGSVLHLIKRQKGGCQYV